MRKVAIVSLGCPRNLVDSETIGGSLKVRGFELADLEKGADIAVINTCSFIASAREESVEAIMQAAALKKEGRIRYLVVCGCLPQLYREKLVKELPEVDLFLGTSDIPRIGEALQALGGKRRSMVSRRLSFLYDERTPRQPFTPPHYAYVKVSEGCDNLCSYCVITRLRGRFRSRPVESVVEEVKGLSASGALKEVDLIGQDTTLFGHDLYGEPVFAELLRRLCRLENSVRWIRILYTHPAHYTDALIEVIREEPRLCKYLDLPVQHISDHILKLMNRRVSKRDITLLLEKIRKDIPGIVIRTSVIVGFPGETEDDFRELLQFLKEARFERLGAFIYSPEEGTRAAKMKGRIPEKVGRARFDEVMRAQQEISRAVNKSFLGRTVDVLIDEKIEGEKYRYLGRTEGDAPEVDGSVYVSGDDLKAGEFLKVRITDTTEYDLAGEAL